MDFKVEDCDYESSYLCNPGISEAENPAQVAVIGFSN